MRATTGSSDGLPHYLQLKQHLAEEIRKGRITAQVPAERALAKRHGVAYMTVRRAVSALVDDGLLYRKPGQGTFVCRPGHVARRTGNLGFVLDPVIADGVGNAFFAKVFAGAEREARLHGQSLIYSSHTADLVPLAAPRARKGKATAPRKVDGLIAAGLNDPQLVLALSRQVPVVLVDDGVEGSLIPSVRVDNVAASRQATRHLIERGHRRIAYLGGSSASIVGRERIGGYVQALVEAGLQADPALIYQATFESDTGYQGAKALFALRAPPTGLFCANDTVAFGALKWLHQAGRKVPGEVGVVGFDDLDASAHVHPALSTVAVPKERIGELAVRTLVGMIAAGVTTIDNPRVVVETRFIVRESC
jgi:DNA-binding LacI/PurR family transcriptional regulator